MTSKTVSLLIAWTVSLSVAGAATYYVDFDGGVDASDGLAPARAWKHCPGDPAATGAARKTKPQGGDTVVFKGGVKYKSTFRAATGREGAPLIYDGNTAGQFGQGRAIIDGSQPVTGWQQCASADEADGNPNWKNIWYAYVPAGSAMMTVNLCQGDRMLPVAQDPNLTDPFFNDDLKTFRKSLPPGAQLVSDVVITPGEGTRVNRSRPLVMLADEAVRSSAVLDDMASATIHFKLPAPATVTAVAVANMSNYTGVKEFSFATGDREILRDELTAKGGLQRFELAEPVTLDTLTFRSHSKQESKRNWGAIGEIQAYTADGANVLKATTKMANTHPDYFTQPNPDAWANATYAFHGGANAMNYRRVVGYDPAAHRIEFETFLGNFYKDGLFAMMNALVVLDRPGEYVFVETPEPDGRHKVYLWPHAVGTDGPTDVTCSRPMAGSHARAIDASGVKHVTIRGFLIRKIGGRNATGIYAKNSENLEIRDNEIALLCASGRGSGVMMSDIENSLIADNFVHHGRRCVGLLLSRYNRSAVVGNRLHKNGSTALDYYGCHSSTVLDNVVTDHKGVHANGLTFYAGCSDILVERNRVRGGNVCLTAQDGDGLTIRNNLFDAGLTSMCIGLWRGKPLRNVTIDHNTLVRSERGQWQGAIFYDNRGAENVVIRNNIIDGLAGRAFDERSHNIYTRWGPAQEDHTLAAGELYVEDLTTLFIDPAGGDYRLRPGSPAIDAGTDVGVTQDIDGTPVPQGATPDIGACEAAAEK